MANKNKIQYAVNNSLKENNHNKTSTAFLDKEIIDKIRTFHKGFSQYEITPLQSLDELAKKLEVKNIWIKDESYRFNLNAFKVLGGSYAIGKYLAEKLGLDISEITFDKLKSEETKTILGDITFVTATDGNHGRGIAWAARELGQKSVVYMPKGSSQIRLENIRKEGADASITDLNYDDSVRLASKYADENNGVLVQDSSWEGYEEIPTWIIQGYATLIDEAMDQIIEKGEDMPTHVFLQAGVGSFAASILGYLEARFKENRPITIMVEPSEAACIYKSALENDGNPHAVTGDMPTIMAGLACGEPSTVGWGILRDYANAYISCPDYVAAKGMRILGNPLGNDPRVISGESGAVGLGILSLIKEQEDLQELANKLKLDKNSNILLINTEGDTDPDGYRRIVWDGEYPSF
ncbi:diaminopropionate ammonia-lyase [Acetoanaerobium pronyense]|uniref:Diaminopropionate ammonia-lyase n=1 Tax=Acetoanaerobium pronyense TaxID=1482736 RepID=A0ABS4KIL2_9FIRM|nr:diaminopropionate ammonia-lyase [Acetoanaerobium pronyense]MBP2026464.1 diaminopropionate ammonia-lyase [Acetoanaerobium pronyense]